MDEFRVPSYGVLIVWIQARTKILLVTSIMDMWLVFYFPDLSCYGWWRISYTSLIHTKIYWNTWRLIIPFFLDWSVSVNIRQVELRPHLTN